jgi:translation initiation factor 1
MSEICIKCGLPKELCVCEAIAREAQIIKVFTEKRKFGKQYTLIEGITDKNINLQDLAKELKHKLACGGTSKGGRIELQGDHIQSVREVLIKMGFSPGTISIKH